MLGRIYDLETATDRCEMNGGRLRVTLLAMTDFATYYLTVMAMAWGYLQLGGDYPLDIYWRLWWWGVVLIASNALIRLYQGNFFYPGVSLSVVEEIRRLFFSTSLLFLLIFAYLFTTRQTELYSRVVLFASYAGMFLLLPISRWGIRSIMKHGKIGQIRTLLVGAGHTGAMIAAELKKDRQLGLVAEGFLDDNPRLKKQTVAGLPILGKVADAVRLGKKLGIHYIIICLPPEQMKNAIEGLSRYYRHIVIVPTNDVLPSAGLYPCDINGYLGLEIRNQLLLRGPRMLKWLLEQLMAITAILTLWPLLLALAVAVKLTSKGPVFYRAKRLGCNGKTIYVLKFRTMYVDADKRLEQILAENPEMAREWRSKFKLSNDPRITPIGKFLRRTSLDELPQFINVLTGEMAVIGPRPIVEAEKKYYGDRYEIFSRVKPGITGLWQVSGRSETDYERRIFLDMYYIMNWSPWLDYFIFQKTIKEVILCRGAQ